MNVIVYDGIGNSSVYAKQTVLTDDLIRISASNDRSCALNDSGKIYCMGEGAGGFGNNTTNDYNVPTLVNSGITSVTFKSVDAGFRSGCGLTTDSKIYCWGEGSQGQLGHGVKADSSVPVLVSGSHSWRYVSTTEYNTADATTCAIETDGDGYCWGEGSEGKIGHGSSVDATSPSLISGGVKWRMISAGNRHSCGVSESNVGYCWGAGADSRLGCAASGDQNTPQVVQGGHSWAEIHAGKENSCGITTSGAAYCWGNDNEGELGNGATTGTQSSPSLVSGSHTFRQMDVCGYSTNS